RKKSSMTAKQPGSFDGPIENHGYTLRLIKCEIVENAGRITPLEKRIVTEQPNCCPFSDHRRPLPMLYDGVSRFFGWTFSRTNAGGRVADLSGRLRTESRTCCRRTTRGRSCILHVR